ncbi:hypothetical protein ACVWZZ_002240 [Bradyrhizobium sp. LM6.10]
MKLGDVATNVLLAPVPKQIQLSFVGTKDNPFSADDMKAHRPIIEKVLQVLRLPADFLLDLLASGDVLEAIYGALDAASLIAQRPDVEQGREARAIRPRHYDFGIARRRSHTNRGGHGTVGMGKRTSIEQVEPV